MCLKKNHENEHKETCDKSSSSVKMSPFGHFFRFIGWWLGFAGLYAMFSICPFCGQQECPVGVASAGSVGAFLSLCLQDWKRLFTFIRRKLFNQS